MNALTVLAEKIQDQMPRERGVDSRMTDAVPQHAKDTGGK